MFWDMADCNSAPRHDQTKKGTGGADQNISLEICAPAKHGETMNIIRNLAKVLLYPLLGNIRSQDPSDSATPPGPPHEHTNRVHVFYGTFGSELAATDYCLTPLGRNKPEPLTRDLPDAMIDTSEVEIVFGEARVLAAIPMLNPRPDVGRADTIILIAEAAFGGLPYSLNDTPVLTYAGAFEVS